MSSDNSRDFDAFPRFANLSHESAVGMTERNGRAEWVVVPTKNGEKAKAASSTPTRLIASKSAPTTPTRCASEAPKKVPRNYAQVLATPAREKYSASPAWGEFCGSLAKKARMSINLGTTCRSPLKPTPFSFDENEFPEIKPVTGSKRVHSGCQQTEAPETKKKKAKETTPKKVSSTSAPTTTPLQTTVPPSSPKRPRNTDVFSSSPSKRESGQSENVHPVDLDAWLFKISHGNAPPNQYGGGSKKKVVRRKNQPKKQPEEEPKEEEEEGTVSTPPATLPPAALPPLSPRVDHYENGTTAPTEKELEYFDKWAILSKDTKLHKRGVVYINNNPVIMQLRELEADPELLVLHHHVAKLLDIFIRKSITKAGGDLTKTKYWLRIDFPEDERSVGWVTNHKTHSMMGGVEIMNRLAGIMQSKKTINLDGGMEISMNVFKEIPPKVLSGKGIKDSDDDSIHDEESGQSEGEDEESTEESDESDEEMLPKNGIRNRRAVRKYFLDKYFGKPIVVGTTHCLPKAVAIGKLKADIQNPTIGGVEKAKLQKQYRKLTRSDMPSKGNARKQLALAKKLLQRVGMNVDKESHTTADLVELAEALPDYQIKLFACDRLETVPREECHLNKEGRNFIGLVYSAGHFDCIRTLKECASPLSFCRKCCKWVKSETKANHYKKCSAKCWNCGWTSCSGKGTEKIHCDSCDLDFKSKKCYEQHLKPAHGNGIPNCSKFFYCLKCLRYDRRARYAGAPHVCGNTSFCHICRCKHTGGHECRHALPTEEEKDRKKKKQENWTMVIYDMECVVVESGEYTGPVARGPSHKPNMICAKIICKKCRGEPCESCGDTLLFSYKDGKPLKNFTKFLLEDPRLDGAKVIAHNGGRYDHPLLLRGIDDYLGVDAPTPDLILNGSTIITATLKYKKRALHFLDSFQFMPMGLAKMPNAFGLTGEAKGLFPYLYNHPDNYEKILKTLPPKEYYCPGTMSTSRREEFEEWYEANYQQEFKLFEEMEKYCRSDVTILVKAVVCYMATCESIFDGWNPFLNACTLASYVMFVLKNMFIKTGDVGVLPENGYGGGNNSKSALKYILWLLKTTPGLSLQYKLCGGEKRILVNGRTYYADAYDEKTKTVYEINGCIFHGCKKCFPDPEMFSPLEKNVKMGFLHERTLRKVEDLESAGYDVQTIWECELDEILKSNSEMRRFFKQCNYTHRLQPRAALYGGRTQAFRSKAVATPEWRLGYFDFTSLYPWLNAGGTAYPRGNPLIVTSGFPDTSKKLDMRGLVYCDVLPPKNAKIGLLPQKINEKLMFVLCRTCGHEQNISSPCPHTDVVERYLTGVWMTDELNFAIERGYKVLKYHEIVYWPEDDWVTDGFFGAYIKPLLKIKHESSGWPESCVNEKDKDAYIEKIFKNDGVRLDRDKIKVNKAMRSLAKLFLNSAWGKFVQNPIKTETKLFYADDYVGMKTFLDNVNYEPSDMTPFGKKKFFVSRKVKSECVSQKLFTNIAIGAQTTCGGRLRLLEAMEKVGYENLVYCDTDSIIFKYKTGTDPLKDLKGEQLGFLTNEIPEGKELVGVIVMAPKVYALKMEDAAGNFSYVVKAKGVNLSSDNANAVTYDTMEESIDAFIATGHADPLLTELMTFKRGHHLLDGIWTHLIEKKLNPRMDKGHYDAEGVITPFGITEQDLTDSYPFY